MNTATIRLFTLPLKRFLDRVSLAHSVIFVIRLPVTVEFSQLFQAKLLGDEKINRRNQKCARELRSKNIFQRQCEKANRCRVHLEG